MRAIKYGLLMCVHS